MHLFFSSGCGDFEIKDITHLPDPCPLPDKEKKRSLDTRERLIYAPMSGVGGIVYDKDVVYVELGPNKSKEQTEVRLASFHLLNASRLRPALFCAISNLPK